MPFIEDQEQGKISFATPSQYFTGGSHWGNQAKRKRKKKKEQKRKEKRTEQDRTGQDRTGRMGIMCMSLCTYTCTMTHLHKQGILKR